MAQSKQAKKRVITNEKSRLRNKVRKSAMRTYTKRVLEAIELVRGGGAIDLHVETHPITSQHVGEEHLRDDPWCIHVLGLEPLRHPSKQFA